MANANNKYLSFLHKITFFFLLLLQTGMLYHMKLNIWVCVLVNLLLDLQTAFLVLHCILGNKLFRVFTIFRSYCLDFFVNWLQEGYFPY